MNKSDVITIVSRRTGLSRSQASAAVTALIDVISNTLKEDGKVSIPGFGTFSVKERAARTGHDLRNGGEIAIPAKKVPVFKAGSALKDAVQS